MSYAMVIVFLFGQSSVVVPDVSQDKATCDSRAEEIVVRFTTPSERLVTAFCILRDK